MADALIAFICLTVNGILLWTCARCSRRLFPRDCWWQHNRPHDLSCLCYPWPYLTIVAAVGLAFFWKDRQSAFSVGRVFAPSASEGWQEWLWLLVWRLVFSFWLGIIILNGLLKFPSDYDTLAYHLALPNFWLHAHSLFAPDSQYWSLPCNNELFTLWLVGPFSGDFLWALTNLPAAVLLACGAMQVGRSIGLSLTYRNLAALAVLTNHIVFHQLETNENDVATAGMSLTCLGYIFRFAASEPVGRSAPLSTRYSGGRGSG